MVTGSKAAGKKDKSPGLSLRTAPGKEKPSGPHLSKKPHDDSQKNSGSRPSSSAHTVPQDSLERTGSTASISHDLSKGSLYVDFSSDGGRVEREHISSSSSDPSLSEKDDSADEPEDEFIEYFSKRSKKRAKARARGPLNL